MPQDARMPWRVRALGWFAARTGASIAAMDDGAIESARAQVLPSRPPLSWLTGPVLPSVRIDVVTAAGAAPDGQDLGIRRYRPRLHRRARLPSPDALPMVVFFHGGGWALGNVSGYDPLCSYLADALGAVVASVDYRLAPHHRAPTAADDAVAATQWLWEHAAAVGADPDLMAVCGDSAGGNLATVVAQTLRDQAEAGVAGPLLRHQALIYPSVDSTRLTPSKMARARGPIISRRDTDAYLGLYLGVGQGALTAYDVRVSPALGRLDGLPPTLLQVAEFDPLRDEAIAYGEALRAAGVPVVCTTYRSAVHGFASFPAGAPGGFRHRTELTREIGRHLLA